MVVSNKNSRFQIYQFMAKEELKMVFQWF